MCDGEITKGVQQNIEMNVQGQLAAIYTRLQEIVSMINIAKKKDHKIGGKTGGGADPAAVQQLSKSDLQKQLETVTAVKEKEEQKIAQQLEEYQKALLQSQKPGSTLADAASYNKYPTNTSRVNILGNPTQSFPESLKVEIPTKKGCEVGPVGELPRTQEAGAGSPGGAVRRPSRESPDSPPDKRCRVGRERRGSGSPGRDPLVRPGKQGGKGGKGIRNRVFCGDCPGCLKNDDCGQCRYCRDKTKFGGQNRLRQKCLHRRCQMDTHRRTSNGSVGGSHSAGQPAGPQPDLSTSPHIYGGVELARFATHRSAISDAVGGGEVRPGIFSSLLGEFYRFSTGHGRHGTG